MSPVRPRLPRRVACLVVPHVALQVAARRQPELLTAPAAVTDGPLAAHRIATAAEPARVPPGAAAAFLAGFELAVLPGIRPLLPRLRALGLARVGDLASLPAAAVAARFGPPGVQAHALARGQDRRLLRPHAGPAERSTRLAFDPPETALDRLLFAARRALNRLEEELEPVGLAAGGLRLTLELAGGGTLPLTAPLLDVAGAGGVALAALRARLDGVGAYSHTPLLVLVSGAK